jgi:lipoprotein-anchoring transpeptidase ErfK/SrfK
MEDKHRFFYARSALLLFLFITPCVVFANTFIFSPRTLQWSAVDSNGEVVRTGHGSAGRSYCPDIHRSCRTPTGTYHILSKGSASCRSSRYPVGKGGAPMPYCMFFSKYYAIHGSYDVPNRNASHGCLRVTPSDARWLHQNFIKIGTKVVIKPY